MKHNVPGQPDLLSRQARGQPDFTRYTGPPVRRSLGFHGYIEYKTPLDVQFTYDGHLIDSITINGVMAYTFTHTPEERLDTITHEIRNRELSFTYGASGQVATITTTDAT